MIITMFSSKTAAHPAAELMIKFPDHTTFATFEVVQSNPILRPTSTIFEYTLQTFEIDSLQIPTQTIYSINVRFNINSWYRL